MNVQNQKDIEVEITVSHLGRSMPSINTLFPITSREHFDWFNTYSSADVWTKDGWLVTAMQDDGITTHLRKGDKCKRSIIQPNTIVYTTKLRTK